MKLIDKDALVTEIEKLKEIYSKCLTRNNYEDGLKEGRLIGYEDALHIINTLEAKEVDLELNSFDAIVCKLGSTYLKEIDRDAIVKALESYKTGDKVKVIITTQKEE